MNDCAKIYLKLLAEITKNKKRIDYMQNQIEILKNEAKNGQTINS